MLDIRKYKKLIGIVLALILLSFFDAARQDVSVHTVYTMTHAEQSEKEVLLAGADKAPSDVDRLIPAKNHINEAMTREEKTTHHEQLTRFIAVVFALFCAIQVVYHTVIRRYGCRMIDVWENIIYIHQIDGKKEIALLYN